MNIPSVPILSRFRKKNKLIDDNSDLFFVRTSDRKRTIEELIQESKLTQTYYFMLIFSSIIVTTGILLNNTSILIAGMMVAPLLKPILATGLGIVTVNYRLVFRSFIVVLVSSIFVVITSMVIYLLYKPYITNDIQHTLLFHPLYFLLAVFSGMAAAFSWTKQGNMKDVLSGIAIAVTILPPLSLLGITLASFHKQESIAILSIYAYNLFIIMLGSMLVFALSGFSFEKKIKKEIDKELSKD